MHDERSLRQVGSVGWISVTPVKALALAAPRSVEVTADGVPHDRLFALVDGRGRIVNGKRSGPLATIVPEYDDAAATLALRFPDGRRVSGRIEIGAAAEASLSSTPRPVHVVEGPWAAALSAFVGVPVRLVRFDRRGGGIDRTASAGAVTLLSSAALRTLAAEGGEAEPLDQRRFRMTFGIDGCRPNAEDAWLGCRVHLGSAVVEPRGNVGRCAITTQDPDTGRPDFDTLGILARVRGDLVTTEPLPFGVWAAVVVPGRVSLGDAVSLEGA